MVCLWHKKIVYLWHKKALNLLSNFNIFQISKEHKKHIFNLLTSDIIDTSLIKCELKLFHQNMSSFLEHKCVWTLHQAVACLLVSVLTSLFWCKTFNDAVKLFHCIYLLVYIFLLLLLFHRSVIKPGLFLVKLNVGFLNIKSPLLKSTSSVWPLYETKQKHKKDKFLCY